MRIEIGIETAQGKAAAELLPHLKLDTLDGCLVDVLISAGYKHSSGKSGKEGCKLIGVDQILHLIVEIGELAGGLAAFSFDTKVEVQRLFGFQIGISDDVDIYPRPRCMPPVKVELTCGRRAVGSADVRLEAQSFVDLVGRTKLAGDLAAEYVVVVPANGRDEQPARACHPLVLQIESGVVHRTVAELIRHTLEGFSVRPADPRALVVLLAVFAADGQQMIRRDLHGAPAVEDQGVVLHIVKAVETAACAVPCPLVLVEIGVVGLQLVVTASVASGILDARGKAVVVVACALRERVLHIEVFLQIVEEDVEPFVLRHVHAAVDVEEIFLAVHVAAGICTSLADIHVLEARAERPFSDLSGVEADALIALSGGPVEGQRSLRFIGTLADDVDDAAECLRAVERACGAAHDLDALHVVHVDALEFVVVHRLFCILCPDAAAVDEDERLVRVHAADSRAVADHRVLLYVDADSEFQRLRECLCAHLVDVCARDDLDGTRRLLHLLLCAGCRDNNLIRMDPRFGRIFRTLRRIGGDR